MILAKSILEIDPIQDTSINESNQRVGTSLSSTGNENSIPKKSKIMERRVKFISPMAVEKSISDVRGKRRRHKVSRLSGLEAVSDGFEGFQMHHSITKPKRLMASPAMNHGERIKKPTKSKNSLRMGKLELVKDLPQPLTSVEVVTSKAHCDLHRRPRHDQAQASVETLTINRREEQLGDISVKSRGNVLRSLFSVSNQLSAITAPARNGSDSTNSEDEDDDDETRSQDTCDHPENTDMPNSSEDFDLTPLEITSGVEPQSMYSSDAMYGIHSDESNSF